MAASARSLAGCAYCAATRVTRSRRSYATSSWMSHFKNDEGANPANLAAPRNSDDPAAGPLRRFRPSSSNNVTSSGIEGLSNLSLHDMLRIQRPTTVSNNPKKPQQQGIKHGRKARDALLRRPTLVSDQRGKPVSVARRIRPIRIAFPQPQARARRFQERALPSKEAEASKHISGDSIGQDNLVPTSASGLPESSSSSSLAQLPQIFSRKFRSSAPTDDVIAEMEKTMGPLIQSCNEALSPSSAAGVSLNDARQLAELREFLKRSISVYRQMKKEHKKRIWEEKFLKTITTSRWNKQRETWMRARAEELKRQRDELKGPTSGGIYSLPASELDTPRTIETSLPTISGKSVTISTVAPLREVPVAKLAHGLERVLFNPGIHWLQDPKSKYYNYPQAIQTVMPKERFNFEHLPRFVPPSQDKDLKELLNASGRTFAGSTSSLTSAMSHIYFALNGKKLLNTQTPNFVDEPRTFTVSSQLPASIVLNRTPEGTYLIDADKTIGNDSGSNVLSQLGNVLEKFLTYEPDEFERFDVKSKNPFRPEESREKREAYHYSGTETLLMRSQLDCHDPRLPRKTFDIKTRATIAIRRDILNHAHAAGYTICKALGSLESFEREKYDLIRAAFLKYSFQARIGKMDGIFLAYHSTERIFGFEYLPLEEIDKYISGSHEESTQAYHLCVTILEAVLKRVIADIPDQSLRLSIDSKNGSLEVISSPLGDDTVSPIKLYNIQLTNYLNGIEMKSFQRIDFASVPGFSSPSSISKTAATNTGETPSQVVNEPDWTVAYDIVTNEDEAYNKGRLRKMRKRQTSLWSRATLPEGLSDEAIERAVQNGKKKEDQESEKDIDMAEEGQKASITTVTADAENVQAKQAKALESINNAGSIMEFVPVPGVNYTARVMDPIVRKCRQIARWGRKNTDKIFGPFARPRKGVPKPK